MTDCPELQISPHENGAIIVDAIEQFVLAARIDEMPSILLWRTLGSVQQKTCGADLHAKLKPYTSSTARKAVELSPTGPNPKRVSRWLEASAPHLSVVFSPLKERGPPRP